MKKNITESRKIDIIENAASSFKAEGYSITENTREQAALILSGKKSASSIINEHARSFSNEYSSI